MARYHRGATPDFCCMNCAGLSLLHQNERRLQGDPRQLDLTFEREARVVLFPNEILRAIQQDDGAIYRLSPGDFQNLICDRFTAMGFAVQQIGSVNTPDGGVDIIACPGKNCPIPFLVAIQCKHHRDRQTKTGPDVVKDLQAVLGRGIFQVGMIVTNTSFTPDAQWAAEQRPNIIRLRDMQHLKRWLHDEFLHEEEWREIPQQIELRPGLIVQLPRLAAPPAPQVLSITGSSFQPTATFR